MECSGLALQVRIGGKNDLFDWLCPHAIDQLVETDVLTIHALKRRDAPVQHMIDPAVEPGSLDREHIQWLLDHTDLALITGGAGTKGAQLGGGNVVAAATELHIGLQRGQCVGQPTRLLLGATQQEECQPGGRFWPNARQPAELFDHPRDRLDQKLVVDAMAHSALRSRAASCRRSEAPCASLSAPELSCWHR